MSILDNLRQSARLPRVGSQPQETDQKGEPRSPRWWGTVSKTASGVAVSILAVGAISAAVATTSMNQSNNNSEAVSSSAVYEVSSNVEPRAMRPAHTPIENVVATVSAVNIDMKGEENESATTASHIAPYTLTRAVENAPFATLAHLEAAEKAEYSSLNNVAEGTKKHSYLDESEVKRAAEEQEEQEEKEAHKEGAVAVKVNAATTQQVTRREVLKAVEMERLKAEKLAQMNGEQDPVSERENAKAVEMDRLKAEKLRQNENAGKDNSNEESDEIAVNSNVTSSESSNENASNSNHSNESAANDNTVNENSNDVENENISGESTSSVSTSTTKTTLLKNATPSVATSTDVKRKITVSGPLKETLDAAAAEKKDQEVKTVKREQERKEKAEAERRAYLQTEAGKRELLVEAAYSRLGVPYVWGGTDPDNGMDCSGFTQWVYSTIDIATTRTSESQYAAANEVVSVSEAEPGDILYTSGHVGIYIGDGAYIHEPQSGDVCRIAYNIEQFSAALKFL